MLTTIVKMIPINAINVIEYYLDQGLTSIAAPRNSRIRKFFDKTFGFSRGTMANLAVNSKTWFLGSIVMGAVDTALVVVQLIHLNPLIIKAWFADTQAGQAMMAQQEALENSSNN